MKARLVIRCSVLLEFNLWCPIRILHIGMELENKWIDFFSGNLCGVTGEHVTEKLQFVSTSNQDKKSARAMSPSGFNCGESYEPSCS